MATSFFYAHYNQEPHFNMAFDEWLWSRAEKTPGMVAIRLYSWHEGTITFGYNQLRHKAFAVDKVGDTPVIRRVTGGRALYHDPGELTYAVVVNHEFLKQQNVFGSVHAVSNHISEILLTFLHKCGIDSQLMRHAQFTGAPKEFHQSAPCFESYSRHEIMRGRDKIIASAQRQSQNALLQHGSIKLHGLVSHPALPLEAVEIKKDNVLSILPDKTFYDYAEVYRSCFEEKWQVRFQAGPESDWACDSSFLEHLQDVKIYPTKKRELIKQAQS